MPVGKVIFGNGGLILMDKTAKAIGFAADYLDGEIEGEKEIDLDKFDDSELELIEEKKGVKIYEPETEDTIGGELMTEDTTEIPVKTEGLDVDLTHRGAQEYRDNTNAYGELNREQTQALGAARALHEYAETGDVEDVDIHETVEHVRENDLTEEMVDYKRSMPDHDLIQSAADAVVETLENADDYMDEAQTEADLYRALAEEQSETMTALGRALDEVHEAAYDVDTDDYTFAEDLRDSRETILQPNEQDLAGIFDDIRNRSN